MAASNYDHCMIISLLHKEPDYYDLSTTMKNWSNDLTLQFYKKKLNWDNISDNMKSDNDFNFLVIHPELHKYYNWDKLTYNATSKSHKSICSGDINFIPGNYPKLPWNSKILTERIISDHVYQDYNNSYPTHCRKCFVYVTGYPHLPWDYKLLSKYGNLDLIKFVMLTPHKSWDWEYLTKYISLTFIIDNPQFDWNINEIFKKLNETEYYGYSMGEIEYMRNKYNYVLLSVMGIPSNICQTIIKYL